MSRVYRRDKTDAKGVCFSYGWHSQSDDEHPFAPGSVVVLQREMEDCILSERPTACILAPGNRVPDYAKCLPLSGDRTANSQRYGVEESRALSVTKSTCGIRHRLQDVFA
jgi:hypothetical protein